MSGIMNTRNVEIAKSSHSVLDRDDWCTNFAHYEKSGREILFYEIWSHTNGFWIFLLEDSAVAKWPCCPAKYLKKFNLKKYIVCFWAEDGGFWLTEVLVGKNGQNM